MRTLARDSVKLSAQRAAMVVLTLLSACCWSVNASAADPRTRIRQICGEEIDTGFEYEQQLRDVEALGEKGRQALLRMANSSSAPDVSCGLYYLIRLHEERAVPAIRRALRNPKTDESTTSRALSGVAEFRDEGSFDQVVAAFRSPSDELRRAAAYALGQLADERSRQLLRDALGDAAYARARDPIVRAIGIPGHAEAVPLLRAVAQQAPLTDDAVLRYDLAITFARISTDESRREALAVYASIPDFLRIPLQNELSILFRSQMGKSRDAAEVASINEVLDQMVRAPRVEKR